jgi:hypothetical protein
MKCRVLLPIASVQDHPPGAALAVRVEGSMPYATFTVKVALAPGNILVNVNANS